LRRATPFRRNRHHPFAMIATAPAALHALSEVQGVEVHPWTVLVQEWAAPLNPTPRALEPALPPASFQELGQARRPTQVVPAWAMQMLPQARWGGQAQPSRQRPPVARDSLQHGTVVPLPWRAVAPLP
jgi:hypothetical protein